MRVCVWIDPKMFPFLLITTGSCLLAVVSRAVSVADNMHTDLTRIAGITFVSHPSVDELLSVQTTRSPSLNAIYRVLTC